MFFSIFVPTSKKLQPDRLAHCRILKLIVSECFRRICREKGPQNPGFNTPGILLFVTNVQDAVVFPMAWIIFRQKV